jgi:chemotaxis protein MotA
LDLATTIGTLAALGMFIWALWSGSGGALNTFWDSPSAILVIGGAVFVTLAANLLDRFLALGRILKNAFLAKKVSITHAIKEIVALSETARRDGILSLESAVKDMDDEFLANGIRLVVDGTDADDIEKILTAELEAIDERHAQGKAVLELLGKYAPAFGMIGTLVGLVCMLKNMEDVSKIGPGMAVALLTTLYGAVLANVLFLPMADKLSTRNDQEILLRTVMIKGLLSLQAGDNPRVTQAKLAVYLPIPERQKLIAATGKE